MKITLNNRPEVLDGFTSLSVKELLEIKNFSYKLLIVRLNDAPITQEQYANTLIQDGDRVAVVHLMTGG